MAAAARDFPRAWIALFGNERDQTEFVAAAATFSGSGVAIFPAFETLPDDELPVSTETAGRRLAVLKALREGAVPAVAATLAAVRQPVPPPRSLEERTLVLSPGKELGPEGLAEWLVEAGYAHDDPVVEPGTFARRGGLLDVYPIDAELPVRVDFFGDEIDSLKTFLPQTQRSTREIGGVALMALDGIGAGSATIFDYLDRDRLLVWPSPVPPAAAEMTLSGRGEFSEIIFNALGAGGPGGFGFSGLDPYAYAPGAGEEKFPLLEAVGAWLRKGLRVWAVARNRGEEERLQELLAARGIHPDPGLEYRRGNLARGFMWEKGGLVVVPDSEIFARYRYLAPRRRSVGGEVSVRPEELKPGDFVVHLDYGVGRYLGTEMVEIGGVPRERLAIRYAGSARLYVPPSQTDLLSRYTGIGGMTPRLDRLGSGRWKRARAAAEKAIARLAQEMLEVQAARGHLPGHGFGPDTHWQREFEASFPYEETPDQERALAEVKAEMEAPRPMDRLLCGDVGYGKTEVAVRAAFKAVMGGKQVAVLVPTTVLAQQHCRTFRERMADYPVRIEGLSRLVGPDLRKQVLAGTASGAVDIVIGTHRLLQKDVAFKDLGLVVVDEEQRFGVRHKEQLKRMRKLVDVLTLTATPIPRTLYLALTGIRELSTIATPPGDRLSVRTSVVPYDPEKIRRALTRELRRGGQVYYLHNRVEDISAVLARVKASVPGARAAVAHGQMGETALARVMEAFAGGGIDILVCTTIIESGLDIPNANTLIVEDAQRFGLADLYQLRGRVGRLDRRAYAYFFYPGTVPLTAVARRRLQAIEEFSRLGAGFGLALRDLEIRGAGNLLGREQHGHIAAVGFELYCRLLDESVKTLKGERREGPPPARIVFECPGWLPDGYIPGERERVEMYRTWSRIRTLPELREWEAELRDRFGPIPPEAEAMKAETELRLAAARAGADTVDTDRGRYVFRKDGKVLAVVAPPRRPLEPIRFLRWLAGAVVGKT